MPAYEEPPVLPGGSYLCSAAVHGTRLPAGNVGAIFDRPRANTVRPYDVERRRGGEGAGIHRNFTPKGPFLRCTAQINMV